MSLSRLALSMNHRKRKLKKGTGLTSVQLTSRLAIWTMSTSQMCPGLRWKDCHLKITNSLLKNCFTRTYDVRVCARALKLHMHTKIDRSCLTSIFYGMVAGGRA